YTVYLDEEIEVNIYLADDEGKLTLTLNGKDYNIEIDDDDIVYVLPELVLGKNNLTFTYENSKYPTKQVNYTIDVASRIVFSNHYPYIGYNSDKGNFSIVLPSNAKGNLSVYIGGWDNENNQYAYKLYKTAKLENGKALISVSDLNLGSYNLVANYTGNDYVSDPSFVSINIIPNIDYPKTVWSKSSNDYSVTAVSPSDALGNMTISIYGLTSEDDPSSATLVDTIYNGAVKGEITRKLPKLESGSYYIIVEYFESYILSNERYEFEVRDTNPDISLKANIPSELVIDVWDENILEWCPTNLPGDVDGKLTLYIDGKVADWVSIDPDDYEEFEYSYSRLRVGNHNWKIELTEDSYYNPTSVNGTFKISKENGEGDISIDIERWTYMNDDYPLATIEAPEDADGNITILIDGELKFNKNIKDCGYDDEDGECVIYAADIDYDWEVKSYRITVNYDDGVYGSYTKSRTVDVEFKYDVLINFYHEVDKNNENDSFLRVTGPEDAKGNITIKINGEIVYDQSVAGKFEDDDDLEIFLSDLTASFDYGTYPIEITYSGDEYVGENVTGNLTVTYQFYGFIDDGMSVSRIYVMYPNMYDFEFVVPEGATGKVTVTFNGESKEIPYDSNGGKYAIDTTKLKLGQYSISATYNGADYPEKTVTVNFTVIPKYSSPYQVSYNEQVTFSAQVPDATGTLTLYEAVYDDYEGEYSYVPLASAPVKNGVATITMKITREMDYYLEYTSGDYKNGFISTIDIVENSPEFKVSVTPSVITAGENIIVTIDTSGVKGTIQISVDGGNSEFIDIVNGKVTKVLSNLGVGQHNINIQYIDGYEDGEGNFVESGKYYSNTFYVTVNAKPAPAPAKVDVVKLTLKKVKVKRSAKKLVLTATLKINGKAKKGLKIKFKFNKKTYTAKTNKKGVAKVTIKAKVLKKLKVGKKVTVQASYGKTVKKFTAKVKK
ncbi:MAG: Ig-like domain-containing protein, partial [Methanobrevibacter sp.]|nr:Ig-like domain-containing protein [Methanobrevibacter sp.]